MSNSKILSKISDKTIKVGVVGLGYVGLPLAVSFAVGGVEVLGFEKSEKKTNSINTGRNYIGDVADNDLEMVVKETKKLSATMDFSRIRECDAIIVCVPTPLDEFKKPDMSYIEQSCIDISKNMKSETFIGLESTTYPTTTEDFMKPII